MAEQTESVSGVVWPVTYTFFMRLGLIGRISLSGFNRMEK
jgi:hypothetical protein